MPVRYYQLFKFSLKQCYQIIVSFYYCHQLTSIRARYSPSHLVYWNGLWEQCLPVGHCPLVWTGPYVTQKGSDCNNPDLGPE